MASTRKEVPLRAHPSRRYVMVAIIARSSVDLIVGQFVVSDKTISRKHLTVEVEEVQPADCV
jgi:hypothetical protein